MRITSLLEVSCYISKLGSECNLNKDLSKRKENN